jgi:formate--tetrahydrofolate ligase
MGAERFFNIKCRVSGMTPDAAVLVVTTRALKAHSGRFKIVAGKPLPSEMMEENPDDVRAGISNLIKQVENIQIHGVTPVVAINAFPDDYDSEHDVIRQVAMSLGIQVVVSTQFVDGGSGAVDLARCVIAACEEPSTFTFLYPDDMALVEKIRTVATRIYGASDIECTELASRQLQQYEDAGLGHLPVCIAKTHLSLSGDPTLRGAPTGHTLVIREVRASVGAGFIYPICGEMMTMPGLGSTPAAFNMDIDDRGNIIGLA